MFVSKLGPTRRSDAAGPAGAGGRYTVHPARSRPGQPRHRGDQRQLRRPRYRKVALRPRLGPRRDLDQPEPQRRLAHQGQRPRLRYAATSTSFRRPVTHAFLSPMHSTPRTLHDVPHRRSAQPMPIGCGLVLASDDITHLVHSPPHPPSSFVHSRPQAGLTCSPPTTPTSLSGPPPEASAPAGCTSCASLRVSIAFMRISAASPLRRGGTSTSVLWFPSFASGGRVESEL